jgi:hypothetical protein
MAKIEHTADLGKFVRVTENRLVNPIHIAKLVSSIKKHNMLPLVPIIVNHKWQVIDGQTRLEAAKKLKTEIYYVMSDDVSIDDIMLLNVNVKAWTMNDYLHTYVSRSIPAYLRVAEFMKEWHFSLSVSVAILANDVDQYLHVPRIEFKSGQLETRGNDYADEFAKRIHMIKPYTAQNIWRQREFLMTLKELFYGDMQLTPEQMIVKLEAWGRPIYRMTVRKEYLRQFEDIWNKGRGESRQIRFT